MTNYIINLFELFKRVFLIRVLFCVTVLLPSLNTLAAENTFSIAVKPQHVTLSQGSAVQTNVEVIDLGKFDEPVYLSIVGAVQTTFKFDFSGSNAGYKAAANSSDVISGAEHWIVTPNSGNKSVSTLTISTYPDAVPGEYIFYVEGQRDVKITDDAGRGGEKVLVTRFSASKARALLKVTVTADPSFIELIEPVEFGITTEQTQMVTPASGYPYMNEIYVTAERSLETIKLEVSLEPDVAGISVGLSNRTIKPGGANMLFVAVTEEAKPGTYYATITAASRGSNNKTRTETTRVEIIVPEKKSAQSPQVSIGDEPKPVKVNCVGNSCPSKPIEATCIGVSCQSPIDLNCSGSLCTESLDIICPDGNCPSSLDLNCDTTQCDASSMNFYCGEGGCYGQAGDGIISDLTSASPSALTVNCNGQGCGSADIIGLCYGDSCPSSIDLNCVGTSCTNIVELNCNGSSCSENFKYDCSGDSCSSELQFDCDAYTCDKLDNFPSSKPYLTGAAPSSNVISTSGVTPSSTSPDSNVEITPVVTPRGSSEVIPASSSDLAALEAAAKAIATNAGACLGAECPIIDCATAGLLLQGLINAEANLDEMYKWLIQASDDALAHFMSLQDGDILTAEQLSQAIAAQGLQEFLHNMGSLLLDIAGLTDTLNNLAEDGFDPSKVKNLDSLYESLKTLEGAVDTVADQGVKTDGTGSLTDLTSGADELLGLKNTSVSSLKSDISDTLSAIENFKAGKPWRGARNVGQIAGRVLKDISAAQMKERQAQIDAFMDSLGKNASAIASSLAFLQKVNNRRFAAEDALKAIRIAKDALLACMAKACDATSLTGPSVTSGFTGWGSALRHFNGMMPSLLAGMNGSFDVKDHCPATETSISLFTGEGFVGGNNISLGGNTSLTASHEVEAKCPRCQPAADKLAVNLSETDYWRAEKSAIEEKLREAEILRERIKLLERRKASNRRGIANMSEGLRNGNAFGFNWGPALAIMLREAESKGRDLQRQITEMTREVERLEVDKKRLETIQERLSELNYDRSGLREDLRYCEEEYCKVYDKDNEAVGRLFGELFGVEIIDVKNVSGNAPFDQRDPISESSDSNSNSSTVRVIFCAGCGGGVHIKVSQPRIKISGPDACATDHYHLSGALPAIGCDGNTYNDPIPLACGFGQVPNTTSVSSSSCPTP